jgi:hypothetical protein
VFHIFIAARNVEIARLKSPTRFRQGCQIILDTIYQKREIYQIVTKSPTGHKIYVPNGRNIFLMAIEYNNLFHSKAHQNLPKFVSLVLKYAIWQPWFPSSWARQFWAVDQSHNIYFRPLTVPNIFIDNPPRGKVGGIISTVPDYFELMTLFLMQREASAWQTTAAEKNEFRPQAYIIRKVGLTSFYSR